MHSDTFKRRLAFGFTVIVSAQNNFLLLFNIYALEYKAVLKFKRWFVCIATHFSLFMRVSLTSLYIYSIIIMVVDYYSSLLNLPATGFR